MITASSSENCYPRMIQATLIGLEVKKKKKDNLILLPFAINPQCLRKESTQIIQYYNIMTLKHTFLCAQKDCHKSSLTYAININNINFLVPH